MQKKFISFEETKRFSKLITSYLDQAEQLKPFYGLYPSVENFKKQIALKKESYPDTHRKILVETLKEQYSSITHSKAVVKNLKLLEKENTFTITTGHQLILMTGPLYFLYKIISTINLCKRLKETYPKSDFVPVYWMASEDHDFEEISSFRYQDKSIRWPREAAGAVGEMSLEDLQPALDLFKQYLGESANAKQLKPILKEELQVNPSFKAVNSQVEHIKKGYNTSYTPQVNPREINLFYLTPNGRYRIEKNESTFHLHGTEQSFSKAEFIKLVDTHPERFSPNVILRPVYQDCILPNLCYIGGGGELAYWFQLNSTFEHFGIPFPILLLRNSALLYSKKLAKKIEKLNLETADLFLKRNELLNKKIRQISNIDLDLSPLKEQLRKQFDSLQQLVEKTDASFQGAVEAQQAKQLKLVRTSQYLSPKSKLLQVMLEICKTIFLIKRD